MRLLLWLALGAVGAGAQVPGRAELSAIFPASAVSGNFHRLEFVANRSRTLEVEGAWATTNTRVQVFRGYGSNGAVSGTVQEWSILLTGRTEYGEIAARVVNRAFAKCLDALATIAGSMAIQPCAAVPSQIWVLRPDPGSGGIWLISYFFGLALEASSLADGAAVFLAPISSAPLQKFAIVNLGGGSPVPTRNLFEFQDYQIVSRAFPGRVVAASWISNGASVVTKSASPGCWDRWRFGGFSFYSDYYNGPESGWGGVFALLSLRPGSFDLCRPAAAAEIGYSYMGSPNMPITMWSFYQGVNQGWQVVPSRNPGFAHLVNTVSGMLLQANGNGEWTGVTQAIYTGATNQEFQIVPLSTLP